jgi:hypothetical protein
VQLRRHADGERLSRPDAEELLEHVRVKIIDRRIHDADWNEMSNASAFLASMPAM